MDGEPHLDTLLHDWAARHALSLSRSESIRRTVPRRTQSPASELTAAWWNQVFGTLAAALQQSTDMTPYLRRVNR